MVVIMYNNDIWVFEKQFKLNTGDKTYLVKQYVKGCPVMGKRKCLLEEI